MTRLLSWTSILATLILALLLLVAPLTANAQSDTGTTSAALQFQNEGIFGCNVISGANSAGAMAAIGGVYVPVNDAAVTLNTGILVYKECILRPMQNKLREKAMADLERKSIVGIETGREGNKRYVVNPAAELKEVDDKKTLSYLTSTALDGVRQEYREPIKRALATSYQVERNGTGKTNCTFAGDLNAAQRNPTNVRFVRSEFEKFADPGCIIIMQYMEQKSGLDAARSEAKAAQAMIWDWGRGFYAVTDNSQDPTAEKIFTPSSVVQESFQQILGSPVRQLESANDIGQMIGALFASLTTQVLTDSRGLAGLSQRVAGQPSYLDQLSRESSSGVIGAAVNAAISILNAARQIEVSYLSSMNAVASNLTNTIAQLRTKETQCWELVVPRVQSYASDNDITLSTQKIRVSTSSLAFAQQVIDSQINPLAQAAVTNVQSSQRALGLIDQLIAGVTNTASINAQRLALQQLDSLVAQRALHTATDATNAASQRDSVVAAMANLVTDTVKAWADSTDPSVGWCNYNNQSVVAAWAERWKQ